MRRLARPTLLLASASLAGCASSAVAKDVWPNAWRWANEDRIAVTFAAGGGQRVRFERLDHGGDARAQLLPLDGQPDSVAELVTASLADVDSLVAPVSTGSRAAPLPPLPESRAPLSSVARLCPPGTPEREAMVREALDGPLRSAAAVVACYELDPPVRFPGDESMTTALMVVVQDDKPLVLARGPLGWTPCKVVESERTEPNFFKKATAVVGTGGLLGLGVLADVALGALIVGVAAGLIWVAFGCPGLH